MSGHSGVTLHAEATADHQGDAIAGLLGDIAPQGQDLEPPEDSIQGHQEDQEHLGGQDQQERDQGLLGGQGPQEGGQGHPEGDQGLPGVQGHQKGDQGHQEVQGHLEGNAADLQEGGREVTRLEAGEVKIT